MDNFDLKNYISNNRINDENDKLIVERKKEGYDDREDESVSARRGKEADKKQSFKDRRDDSYGKFGKRDAEAKGKAKGPGKNKINKEGVDLNMEDDLIPESVAATLAGVGALLGSTAGLAKLLDYMMKNYPDQVDKFVKMVDRGSEASYKRMEE